MKHRMGALLNWGLLQLAQLRCVCVWGGYIYETHLSKYDLWNMYIWCSSFSDGEICPINGYLATSETRWGMAWTSPPELSARHLGTAEGEMPGVTSDVVQDHPSVHGSKATGLTSEFRAPG